MTRLLLSFLFACLAFSLSTTLANAEEKPNFLIVVADDLGWSDPGFLGSKIQTPTIDALAARGVFMSNFYVAPTCSPTRSMLMTGVSNHAAGVGSMHNLQAPNQVGLVEYGAQLHDGVVTVAEMLEAHGYATMMSGKWHLAIDEDQRPSNRGFQNSYGLVEGGASHFADQKIITKSENVTYMENGQLTALRPNFYSTIDYTDKIIEYIEDAGEQPFFAYLAYTAPHDPLQVPDAWQDRYKGVFDEGPAKSKEKRRQRLIELALISQDAELAQPLNFPKWLDSHQKPWAERSAEARKNDAHRMEIYAAMVELLDEQLGRVIDRIDASGKLENTYILFMSDNGAAVTTPLAYRGNTRDWLHENFDLSPDAMGKPGSFTTMGRDWTNNSNTPFRLFKGTVGEGGVRSPLVIAGPELAQGETRNTPGHVMDLVPTIFELADVSAADDPLYKDKLLPRGHSILPILKNDQAVGDRMIVTELFGNRMVRNGPWKASLVQPPIGSGEWELFDIVADPSALKNLAESNSDLMNAMIKAYEDFATQNKVVLPDRPMSGTMGITYEGECNWWCERKFAFVDMMLSPRKRKLLFGALVGLILLGGFMFFRRRRKVKSALN